MPLDPLRTEEYFSFSHPDADDGELFRDLPTHPRRKPDGTCSTATSARLTAPCKHPPASQDSSPLGVSPCLKRSQNLLGLSPGRQRRPIIFRSFGDPTEKTIGSNSLRKPIFELLCVLGKGSAETTPVRDVSNIPISYRP